MNFYTNIVQWGNFLLLREIRDGERVNRRVKYSPTLYAPVAKPTEWKTLDGKYVTPIKHDTIKEAKSWVEQYKNQSHLIYGNAMYPYSYIADEYPHTVQYDIDCYHKLSEIDFYTVQSTLLLL